MVNQDSVEQTAQDAMPGTGYTANQMSRKVLCEASDGRTIEVPWRLMIQSKTFSSMWGSLDADREEKYNTEPLVFPLEKVKAECFERIMKCFGIREGVPSPAIMLDTFTQERQWFSLTDDERQFFNVDIEVIKELFLAADFLNISSLYLYCAQELARLIMDKNTSEICEMLGLRDDLSAEQKQQIIAEYSIPDLPPVAAAENGDANAGEGEANGERAEVEDRAAVEANGDTAAGEENGDPAGDH